MPVNDAMVDGQSHIGHRPNEDSVLTIHLAHHGTLLELADAEDRRLSLVEDDRRGEQRAGDSVIGDGEASARDISGRQLALASAAGEVVELRADLLEAERAGVFHDGYDQSFLAERVAGADVARRGY